MSEPSNRLDEFSCLSPGLRDFISKFSKEREKDLIRATMLDRDNQQLAVGDTILRYPSSGEGMFSPDDGTRLNSHYSEAILRVSGMSGEVRIKNVRQGSGLFWDFLIA